jgi:hypothetical protein
MSSDKEGQQKLKLNSKYQFVDLADEYLMGDARIL